MQRQKFPLGRLVATPAALDAVSRCDIKHALARHASGDWGNVCKEDKGANDDALRDGFRLLSVYKSSHGTSFWIITEADRSATTILLPDDY